MANLVERGDIRFVFTPRVGQDDPRGLDDVQRLFAILAPHDRALHRRLVIGRKRLPDLAEHERGWAYVDRVSRRPERLTADLGARRYVTRTLGERVQPSARPLGEGVYGIAVHEAHVHLAYVLARPHAPGDLQLQLGIEPMASFIVAVRNPDAAPAGPGPWRGFRPGYPPSLAARFAGRRFAPLEPDFLDHAGAELILIGTRHVEDELFRDLRHSAPAP